MGEREREISCSMFPLLMDLTRKKEYLKNQLRTFTFCFLDPREQKYFGINLDSIEKYNYVVHYIHKKINH